MNVVDSPYEVRCRLSKRVLGVYLLTLVILQTVTHLKVALHVLIGVLLGLLFEKAGSDASKTISNLGYLLVSVVYLCYTSLMPAVLKCE